MKKKMAFVDLTNFRDWPMGGMIEYELAVLKHLVKEYDVDIWGVSVDGRAQRTLCIDGVKYPVHIFGNVRTSRRLIPNYWRGAEILRFRKEFFNKYDAVYAHTGSCAAALKYMVDRKRTKLFYHQHGLNHLMDHSLMSLIQRPGLFLAQKAADSVFVVSDPQSVAEYERKMKKKTNAHYVPIGSPINLDRFDADKVKAGIAEKEERPTVNFLYTGRLSVFKNVGTLIEAMRLYTSRVNGNAVLKIAGSGEEYDNLKRKIEKYRLGKNVKLLGAVSHDEIYGLLGEADVFLTASGGEGVSVSVLEAYAAGLPVVCFRVPGLERQVIDGVTGVLAKERNHKSFFRAMVKLDSDRTRMALNCADEAKKYDSAKIAKIITDEINRVLESGRR